MNITEFTPTGWAKDKFLKDEILDTLDLTTEQDFIYAISVQGHGAYSVDDSYESKIKVTGLDDESLTREYEYYADQTREMDKFIGSLVKALKKRKEETILVMYGDHLPSLGITAENLKNKNVYQTQYVIWSNFDNDYYKT
ncbi:protein containing Sulfatase domain protein, partial [human gut metagenome]